MIVVISSLLLACLNSGYFVASALRGDIENTLRIGALSLVAVLLLRFRKYLINWLELPFQVLIFIWVIGGFYNFYETIWWYDEMTHFVGPALLALYGLYALREAFMPLIPRWFYVLSLMNFIVMLTVVWEFYEYFIGYLWLQSFQMDLSDTITDLLLGYLGAGIICVWFYYRIAINHIFASWQKVLPWVKSERKPAEVRYS